MGGVSFGHAIRCSWKDIAMSRVTQKSELREKSRLVRGCMIVGCCASPSLASPADNLFAWATITNAGNAAFNRPTRPDNPYVMGRGSVGYEFRIATNEVSTQQYLTFLNTFTTQSAQLADRLAAPRHWGAERDTAYSGPGVRYRLRTDVADAGRLPAIGVSWHQAALFINWLNNDLSSDPSKGGSSRDPSPCGNRSASWPSFPARRACRSSICSCARAY